MNEKIDNVQDIKMKYLNSTQYYRKHIADDRVRRKVEKLLNSPSPITEFKKIPGKNRVVCSLRDGTSDVIPVNETLQLFFDKMEMHPDIVVDFGKDQKNRVEILPFQNKIVYINGRTNQVIKSLPLDSNLIYSATDSITGKNIEMDSRLNPAVLAILHNDLADQKAYINGTGEINVCYNFEEKSDKITENTSNKNLAKTMNKYYQSEKEYVKELELENNLSQKVGYVNILDKLQSSFTKQKTNSENSFDENLISFDQAREEFKKGLQIYQSSPISSFKSSDDIKIKATPNLER